MKNLALMLLIVLALASVAMASGTISFDVSQTDRAVYKVYPGGHRQIVFQVGSTVQTSPPLWKSLQMLATLSTKQGFERARFIRITNKCFNLHVVQLGIYITL